MNRDGLWCLIVSMWMFWAVYGLGTGMETGSMYSQKTENCWHTLMGTCIGLWADRNYVYVAERGGGLTIIDMELNVRAQLGFYNSSIRAHGMCGNSRGELFLMPLTTYDRHFLMKLSPVAVPGR